MTLLYRVAHVGPLGHPSQLLWPTRVLIQCWASTIANMYHESMVANWLGAPLSAAMANQGGYQAINIHDPWYLCWLESLKFTPTGT